MGMNLNNVNLVGRLADNVEYTPSGESSSTSRAVGRLAVNRPPRKNGSVGVDYIPIVAWGVHADNMAKYTQKGKELTITGHIKVNSVQPRKEGESWRTYTEVEVETISFGRDSSHGKVMQALQGAKSAMVGPSGNGLTELARMIDNNPAVKDKLKAIVQGCQPQATTSKVSKRDTESKTKDEVESPFAS
jgi:single-stranded DNA-binding protein